MKHRSSIYHFPRSALEKIVSGSSRVFIKKGALGTKTHFLKCSIPSPTVNMSNVLETLTPHQNENKVLGAGNPSSHVQIRPGTSLLTVSIQLRTIRKGLSEHLKRARIGSSYTEFPYPRYSKFRLHWPQVRVGT